LGSVSELGEHFGSLIDVTGSPKFAKLRVKKPIELIPIAPHLRLMKRHLKRLQHFQQRHGFHG
jgi:hypothetical protein